MSRLTQKPRVELSVNLQLSEAEVRALDALAGYGEDAFLRVFYKEMGKAYMEPHEAGLRSLFQTIRAELPAILHRHDNAKLAFALGRCRVRSVAEDDERTKRFMARDAKPLVEVLKKFVDTGEIFPDEARQALAKIPD